jgi:hypothetical protein
MTISPGYGCANDPVVLQLGSLGLKVRSGQRAVNFGQSEPCERVGRERRETGAFNHEERTAADRRRFALTPANGS